TGFTDESDPKADLAGAVGFYATGASFDIAIVKDSSATPKTWIGLAAHVDEMGVVGMPDGFTLKIKSLDLLDNIAPTGSTAMDWKGLADQDGDDFGLDNTQLVDLTSADSFVITGAVMISIMNYVYISGAIALEHRDLNAKTVGSSSTTAMSALTLGAKN